MAGPYGITQFDAAGVLGNYQAMQENRIRSMILEKQMANEERKANIQAGVQSAIQRYAGKGESVGAAGPSAATAAAGTYAPINGDPLAPLPDAQSPQPRPQTGDRRQLFTDLMALDLETAKGVMEAFASMDKAEASAAAERNLGMMQIAAGIMQLPYEQRRAALQQSAGELQALGFTPEQLSGFDPTDQNLRQIVAQGMDMERIVKFVLPDLMNVNGDVIDAQSVARGDSDPVRYRSEFIDTPQGLARRPNAGAPPQTLTDDDIIRMEGGQAGGGSPGGFL